MHRWNVRNYDEENEFWGCLVCDGMVMSWGCLGNREHGRCECCGMEQSRKPLDEEPETDLS